MSKKLLVITAGTVAAGVGQAILQQMKARPSSELNVMARYIDTAFLPNRYANIPIHFRYFFSRKVCFAKYSIAFVFLPGGASVPYQGTVSALVDEASWFILRGIGMRDAAIASALAAAAQHQFQLAPAS